MLWVRRVPLLTSPFFIIEKMTKYLCENWLLEEIDMKTKYKLLVKGAGNYTADSLIELFWIVFKHRCEHLRKGEGFCD